MFSEILKIFKKHFEINKRKTLDLPYVKFISMFIKIFVII